MSYLMMKRKVRVFIKRRKSKKYIRILINRQKAEVTIETAIVFTIILFLIGSMIYFGLYLHDKVAIKSYAYSGLVDGADKDEGECEEFVRAKIKKAPLFVIRPKVSVSGNINEYRCNISESEHSSMKFLDKIMEFTMGKQDVEVVRKMPIDKMYLFKAIKDGIKK